MQIFNLDCPFSYLFVTSISCSLLEWSIVRIEYQFFLSHISFTNALIWRTVAFKVTFAFSTSGFDRSWRAFWPKFSLNQFIFAQSPTWRKYSQTVFGQRWHTALWHILPITQNNFSVSWSNTGLGASPAMFLQQLKNRVSTKKQHRTRAELCIL